MLICPNCENQHPTNESCEYCGTLMVALPVDECGMPCPDINPGKEPDKIVVIENTKAAQFEYGRMWGSRWNQITREQIQALLDGKQIAFHDGEYTNFISLEKPI